MSGMNQVAEKYSTLSLLKRSTCTLEITAIKTIIKTSGQLDTGKHLN
jgi:hypothetical protein